MGVFKEEAYMFETVAKKQTRIYSDAADFGYPFNEKNPPREITHLINAVKSLQKLDKQFPEERGLVRERYTWKGGVQVRIRIAWEEDEGYYNGTEYEIHFNRTKKYPSLINKDCNAFIAVHINNYKEKV